MTLWRLFAKLPEQLNIETLQGPLGSPERGVWGSVYYWDYGVFSGPARLREFVLMHAWIGLLPHIHALHHPSLSAFFSPSIYHSFLQMDAMDA